MKITCDAATTICDKSQYGEATFWELFQLKTHLLFCDKCRNYSKQNGFITKCMNKSNLLSNHEISLSDIDKQKMDQNLKEKL